MTEYRVVVPEEVFAVAEWEEDGLPAICVINQALANFEPKIVFGWHLSIIIEFQQSTSNGMPLPEEKELVDQIGDELDVELKANGNALRLARITFNGARQLLYRVYDPEVANAYLKAIIDDDRSPRPFSFEMRHDETWQHAKIFLRHWEEESGD